MNVSCNPPITRAPPARVAVNRLIKEILFDRALTDALLYSGTYGVVIQRGVAEALCRAISGSLPSDGTRCQWPDPRSDNANYISVTHSLGNRISYDVLLSLYGDTTNPNGVFTREEQKPPQQHRNSNLGYHKTDRGTSSS